MDITKTESNNKLLFYCTLSEKTWKSCFCFFTEGKQHESREAWKSCFAVIHGMITPNLECPWHNCIICSYDVMGADFENVLYAFGQSEKSWRVQCIINITTSIRRENMLGYLSADIICSEKRTVFREYGQISEHIFAPNGGYRV